MAEAFSGGGQGRSTRDQKLLNAGISDFESILNKEEKSYSVSLLRRRKLLEKHNLAVRHAEMVRAQDEFNLFEKTEREKLTKKLNLLEEERQAQLKEAKSDVEAKIRINTEFNNRRAALERSHTETVRAETEKLQDIQSAYYESVIQAETELNTIRRIYNENLSKSLPVMERLAVANQMAEDAEKKHLESKLLLEDAIYRSTEEGINKELAAIEEKKRAQSDLLSTLMAQQAAVAPDSDEWAKLNSRIEECTITLDALGKVTKESLAQGAAEAIERATADVDASIDDWINKLNDKTSLMRSAAEYKHNTNLADQSPTNHSSTLGAEAYIGSVQKDIAEATASMEAVLIKQAELQAQGDTRAAEELGKVAQQMQTLIREQEASIELTTKDEKGNTVLTELGKMLKDQNKDKKSQERKERLGAAKTKAQMNSGDSLKDGWIDFQEETKALFFEKMSNKAEDSKHAAAEKNSEIANNIENAFRNAIDDYSKTIDNNINSFYEYQSALEGRLQGSGESYEKMLTVISTKLLANPYVSQKEVVNNIKTLVESGVSYNVELRSFLQTVSEDIAATFDAFDKNLLRIVRIQQADSTAARLGMEASLTKLFNSQYQDTSYLADSVSDSVSGAILEASSMLSHQNSLEFEYAVQKWLGSMYSVGVSDSTVNRIAQGLNYLGTGNIEALSGDESMQTLFAMAATKANVSYSDILTHGLGAEDTNKLLRSMTEYLLEIAQNTDNNQVTKSAYSNLFGISMSDLSAITNLYDENYDTLESLSKSSLTMAQAEEEVMNQINLISSRVHASQFIDTMVENILSTMSVGIGSNGVMYGMWKALNIVDDLTGGIYIPGITAHGYGITSEINILNLAKIGMAGTGLLASLIGGLSQGAAPGGLADLSSWGYDTTTRRGAGRKAMTSGVSQGISQREDIMGVGSSSTGDIKETSKEQAASEAGTSSDEQQTAQDEAKETAKNTLAALDDGETTVVEEIAQLNLVGIPALQEPIMEILGLLGESRIFKTDGSGAMSTIQELLSPNRVFYSMNPVEIAGATNSFKYNSDSSMLLYDIGGNYASNVESAVDVLMTSSILSAISAISSGTIVGGASISGATSIASTLSDMTTATSVSQSTATSSDVSAVVSEVKEDVSDISTSITALYADLMTNKSPIRVESNQSENMKVSVGDISGIRAPLTEAVKEAMLSSFGASLSGGEEPVTLVEALIEALGAANLQVTVTNDNFDTVLSAKAYDI